MSEKHTSALDKKVLEIVQHNRDKFNNLSMEEGTKIREYTSEMQILTLWQVINSDKNLSTSAWRNKQMKWLNNCI